MTTSDPILYETRWPATALEQHIRAIDVEALAKEYEDCVKSAPRRVPAGRKYFVGHTGELPTGDSNRLEEHYAVRLWHLGDSWPREDGGWFKFLDYQMPLKAYQGDKGIGKIDLLGG